MVYVICVIRHCTGLKEFIFRRIQMKLSFTATIIVVVLLLSGCSETWKGVKKDSATIWSETKQTTNNAVESTKEVIHNATE